MIPLTEDKTKALLRANGLPVPKGRACASPAEVAEASRLLGGAVVIKALVATGRRGKSGAVRSVSSPPEAAAAASALLGTEIGGLETNAIYVEERIAIAEELYLSFVLDGFPPKVLLSRHGGVEIEETRKQDPDAVIVADLEPLAGIQAWEAVALWKRAGVSGAALSKLGHVTRQLFQVFQAADAITLELNPLALDVEGKPVIVGAMMAIDDSSLPRQSHLLEDLGSGTSTKHGRNPREQMVYDANYRMPGGMIRYTELEGDIGLIVCGGGAGLYQHDLILGLGGRLANHSDQNGINVAKLKVLVTAVLENPRVRGLLVGANHQQMTRTDRKVQAVIEVLRERGTDATRFPIVIRMFGPHEEKARALAAEIPGVHYLPRDASMADACRLIVELTAKAGDVQGQST
ncbi:MAG: acetate--CoA ligase family protein [Betaproteobacteria bacterium]|nr:acetate--CoA ligase family protein [Betaproteobacteria bacterium]